MQQQGKDIENIDEIMSFITSQKQLDETYKFTESNWFSQHSNSKHKIIEFSG